ncbi:hypothetical protein FHR83_000074 [Actinoplanes campanulatus]|uniref:Uncharacterized protein n=1 Tax=Actinoplanes campanulatus TaxID=113559 RepID=A0A7W5FBQ3_9ACTN|nr:hypothetical protein [Actinoplanes campanulatus]MBB3092440.1 hypothetical protein [Actinoplanes campanulatus]GGN47497.1 hypothetical protein GCM10010109_83800 [Actinoplanes campanulatus]GID34466.1 hypothetical protein Aca09nite_09720 [Actinoplanes campanulatus]
MRLIPPMDDEPPPEYVAFVTLHAPELRAEAFRLVGGAPVSEEIYLAVLTDLAGHWRRMRWLRRTGGYVRKRLLARTAQWREDQVYEVEVRVLRPPEPVVALPRSGGSLALRKAAIIGGTARASLDALADAEIAWVHAGLRSRLRRTLGYAIGSFLLVLGLIQYMAWLSTDPL